jgi:hypothetical protein
MTFRTKSVVLLLFLTLILPALGGCGGKSGEQTTAVSAKTTATSQTTASSETTSTAPAHLGAAKTFVAVGDVAQVEQGQLSVSKVTVTNDIASPEADALLYTGAAGEGKNVSKAPASGIEFLMITFTFKKDPSYAFQGGVLPSDIISKNAAGTEYSLVQTAGDGGIFDSKPGKVEPGVQASVTPVFEVPKGETGLVLVYHQSDADGFTVNIR